MKHEITGIHHVTALSGAPGPNLRFYTKVLGLRLVKKTVNFDDPSSYHFYYGDRVGTPGTLLTFFPHPLAKPGRPGAGEVATTHFAVPRGSLDYWEQRLSADGIASTREAGVGGYDRLVVVDPHATRLSITESDLAPTGRHPESDVPAQHAITSIGAVTVVVNKIAPTADFLTKVLGFRELARSGGRATFAAPHGPATPVFEVLADPDSYRPLLGAGSVHHVAWRVPDDDAHRRIREHLEGKVAGLSDVRDRNYFHSIYFREPGGVIFEIATDNPGFAIDEPESSLGISLKLPAQFEPHRAEIESALPKLENES